MLLNFYKYLIFMPLVMISSMLILILDSWFSQWMIMEINLISFIGLIMLDKQMNSSNLMNYFLIQSFNSYIFILMTMNLNYMNMNMNFLYFLLNLSLLTKMGIPPFYFWYLKIMKNLNWMNLFILMTIQKIIPMIILNNLMNLMSNNLMNFNLVTLTFMSFICSNLGVQNLDLKILISYSSIIQMTWIIMLMYLNEVMSMNYFLIYFIISLTVILIFKKFNLNNLNELNLIKFNKFSWINIFLFMSVMSLAGIPPFFGFLMKWISIQNLNLNFPFLLVLLMILNSLISMFFYLRLLFLFFMNYNMFLKFNLLKVNFEMNLFFKLILFIWFMNILILVYEIF
uniref:NADH-ubiquinone oxidoreductase chain 2 n=1 Tax=Eurytoma sp. TJS-2016 TaxID=1855182 RepID=A0A1X9HYD2_9HYME|nr:NADH dehydrogenase subunit 2 [Eurytoma sp. TJS-2016]